MPARTFAPHQSAAHHLSAPGNPHSQCSDFVIHALIPTIYKKWAEDATAKGFTKAAELLIEAADMSLKINDTFTAASKSLK